jgi:hypothetical protein
VSEQKNFQAVRLTIAVTAKVLRVMNKNQRLTGG